MPYAKAEATKSIEVTGVPPPPPPPIPTWALLLPLVAVGAVVIYAATRK